VIPRGAQRVLVTGGGSGIGLAVAEAVLAAGGQVAVTGRRPEPLQALARAHPGRVHALPGDLCDPTFRDRVVDTARAALGGLDGLVHSAGVVFHQLPGQIDEAALRAQLELNLVAPLRLGAHALEALEPGGGMVFVSSTLAHRPLATSAVYSASKAGLLAVMKTLAVAGAPRQIRANAVSPGGVQTGMIHGREDALSALHPLGRLGTPAEVASAILHLLTAPWTTGTELVIDGGLLLRE
jgi:3-oxoacyl-[acyl-carrier protein] reductase